MGRIITIAFTLLTAFLTAGCEDEQPAPAAPAVSGPVAHELNSPLQALDRVMAQKPLVLAVGEYHQTEATSQVPSAVKRFTETMLASLKGQASHLLVETWMATGNCGEVEQKATADIGETTKRPEVTEDELVTLLKKAKGMGIKPHILELECADYASFTKGDDVDYGKLLVLTKDKLERKIVQLLKDKKGSAGSGAGTVIVYGGAIHNDLDPMPDDKPFTFGPQVAPVVQGKYVELDLVVPAFVDPDVIREYDWYELYLDSVKRKKMTLIERNPSSFILVFPR